MKMECCNINCMVFMTIYLRYSVTKVDHFLPVTHDDISIHPAIAVVPSFDIQLNKPSYSHPIFHLFSTPATCHFIIIIVYK